MRILEERQTQFTRLLLFVYPVCNTKIRADGSNINEKWEIHKTHDRSAFLVGRTETVIDFLSESAETVGLNKQIISDAFVLGSFPNTERVNVSDVGEVHFRKEKKGFQRDDFTESIHFLL